MTQLQPDQSRPVLVGASTQVASRPAVTRRVHVVLALLAIYVLWGSTYLAIRVAVEAVPPLLAAGARFFIAGTALYIWSRARGVPQPSPLEWRNLSILGALMFLAAYSGLFWAEKTLPSGIASVHLKFLHILRPQRWRPPKGGHYRRHAPKQFQNVGSVRL